MSRSCPPKRQPGSAQSSGEQRTEKRNHVCNQCSQPFHRPAQLKNHVLVEHEGKRPHVCDTCGETYKYPTDVKRHQEKHDGSDPRFKCRQRGCDKRYTRGSSLKKHMQKKHRETVAHEPSGRGKGRRLSSPSEQDERSTHRDSSSEHPLIAPNHTSGTTFRSPTANDRAGIGIFSKTSFSRPFDAFKDLASRARDGHHKKGKQRKKAKSNSNNNDDDNDKPSRRDSDDSLSREELKLQLEQSRNKEEAARKEIAGYRRQTEEAQQKIHLLQTQCVRNRAILSRLQRGEHPPPRTHATVLPGNSFDVNMSQFTYEQAQNHANTPFQRRQSQTLQLPHYDSAYTSPPSESGVYMSEVHSNGLGMSDIGMNEPPSYNIGLSRWTSAEGRNNLRDDGETQVGDDSLQSVFIPIQLEGMSGVVGYNADQQPEHLGEIFAPETPESSNDLSDQPSGLGSLAPFSHDPNFPRDMLAPPELAGTRATSMTIEGYAFSTEHY